MPYSVDSNQKPIVADLRRLGFSVQVMSDYGKGLPDLLIARRDLTIAVEIKTESASAYFYVGQLEWMANWSGGFCGFARKTNDVIAMFDRPNYYCLSRTEKDKLLAFVEKWKLDKKGNKVSVKLIDELLERK